MPSVFRVADYLLEKAPTQSLNSVKLQKLVFYAYAWYAHQTGESLFDEPLYAMEHGPVVGPLLSSHSGQKVVTRKDLTDTSDSLFLSDYLACEDESFEDELDPYTKEILDAVWNAYRLKDGWQLEELSHQEQPWIEAWSSRTGMRADMRKSELIDFFTAHRPQIPSEVDIVLPDPKVTFLQEVGEDTGAHPAFLKSLGRFL